MSAVRAVYCCAATTGRITGDDSRSRFLWRSAICPIGRLPVCRIVCSAPGTSNGRPGGSVDRAAAESLNGNFSPGPDEFLSGSSPNYGEQDVKPRRKFQPASGREVSEGEEPFRLLENGQKVYLDELDVISLLEPPKYLRPFQALNYNHAAFLWKKIGDIPEERRHRLLDLLLPRQITKMWSIAKLRYDDPDLFVDDAEGLISKPALQNPGKSTVWDGRIINGFFSEKGKVYGRVKTGGPLLEGLQGKVAPLYYEVQQAEQVMATDEYCDLMFDYADGQLHLKGSLPPGFPDPVRHLPPFNDKTCDYIRAVGPGVVVGQGWVEGSRLGANPSPFVWRVSHDTEVPIIYASIIMFIVTKSLLP